MTTGAPPTRPVSATEGNGLLWGTVFILAPYLLVALGLLLWSWPQDTLPEGQCEGLGFGCTLTRRDTVLFAVSITAPIAVLATGLTWLVVLLLRRGRTASWPGPVHGAVAAGVVYAGAAVLVMLQLGPAVSRMLQGAAS